MLHNGQWRVVRAVAGGFVVLDGRPIEAVPLAGMRVVVMEATTAEALAELIQTFGVGRIS